MDEQDILEEIKALVERASVFSDATVEYTEDTSFEIDLPREGKFLVMVRLA